MRKQRGKWIVSQKDTYSNECINSVMLAYVTKLYETIKDRETIGIPMYYVEKQAGIQGVDDKYSDKVNLDAAHQLRLKDLEELIWVYTDNEPNIEDYDFHIDFVCKEGDGEFTPVTFNCTNDAERDRFHMDQDAYWKRKLEGYELAGKLWRELQW